MSQLSIVVNGRRYDVACDDGEEDRVRRLAERLDRRVAALAAQMGQIGEARLLLLAALMAEDEALEAERRTAPEVAVEDSLEILLQRIEAVADRLKAP